MAITAITETWRGESWSDETDGSREYERVFTLYSNDPLESAVAVRTYTGLPLPGEPYPDDAAAYVTNRSARRPDNSRLIWEVTVSYAFQVEEPEDPLNMAAVIRWSSGLYERAVYKDRNGDAICNSAGDFFDPPSMAEFPVFTVNVQKNLTAVPTAILSYIGAVNSAEFTVDGVSIPANKARIVGLEVGEKKVEQDVQFRTVTFSMEVRDEEWKHERLDEGLRIKDAGVLKDILVEDEDGNKERASSPLPLDGAGARLSDPTPTTVKFREFDIYPQLDFNSLPLA